MDPLSDNPRRFQVSQQYRCDCCGAPGVIYVFAWPSRQWTGQTWCWEHYERLKGVIDAAGLNRREAKS